MINHTLHRTHVRNLTLVLLFLSIRVSAQFPSLSPPAIVRQEIGATNIHITYERPAARGRTIFGSLVPYGKLWRAGAGNCTKINFSKPVTIGKTSVPAGTYSLFAIPDVKSWTIILNSDTTLYGLDGYQSGKDIVRITAPVQTAARSYESFTIDIDVVPNNAVVYLSWANTQVSFPVDTGIDAASMDFIKANLLTKHSTDSEAYAAAAEYLYYLNRDLDMGLTLINQGLALQKQRWYYRMKIDILERQKKFSEAVAVADEAIKWADSNQSFTATERADSHGSYERIKRDLLSKIPQK